MAVVLDLGSLGKQPSSTHSHRFEEVGLGHPLKIPVLSSNVSASLPNV